MKILIVDDDEMVVDSFEVILSTVPEFEIVGSAYNGQEAIEFCKDNPVEIVLMDIQMPVTDGIAACRIIKYNNPEIKIIMLTTFHDYKSIHQSLQAGASGYLLKSDDLEKQKLTIQSVYAGLPIISEEALKSFREAKMDNQLTLRENEILELIANGLSNKEIASQLYISEGTVRNNVSIILDKLELRDRTQLAIYYWQLKTEE
ncbi:MAG TPA: response regulator transcription factor [Halanaerobiales bacterium]|nr:response regulator transcription factor [Halanaerobiales bacterium]